MGVTRDQVRSAYQLILGREPESNAAINAHLKCSSIEELRRCFISSPEFRDKYRLASKDNVGSSDLYLPLTVPRSDIQTDVTPEQLAALLKRVENTWRHLGSQAPHWSVLTDPRYLPSGIDQNRTAFDDSGTHDLSILDAVTSRCAPDFDLTTADVIEYGCGVGRVTSHLASRAHHVTACDVSAPHLELARRHLADFTNVSLVLVTAQDLMPKVTCDLWFSRIVLQHNPPPLIATIIRLAFSTLRPGGLAVFQVPTYQAGYSFTAESYLGSEPSLQMEMHAIAQADVFRIAANCGVRLLEVREDDSVGAPHLFVSNLFCFQRIDEKEVGMVRAG